MVLCVAVVLSTTVTSSDTEENWKPIRITMFYTEQFRASFVGKNGKFIQDALSAALEFLKNTVSVQPMKTPIIVTGKECREMGNIINLDAPEYKNGVKDTDLVILASSSVKHQCAAGSTTLAFAFSCSNDGPDNRPIIGSTFFCLNNIKGYSWNFNSTVSLLVHEILHILVFNPTDLFRNFYNRESKKKLGTVLRTVQWPWKISTDEYTERTKTLVVTPKVLEAVRHYTGCADLEGAELENNGAAGTALSHWEKRIFGPEIMTGTESRCSVFSNITAALLEDSGWYRVNRSMVSELLWGKGLGCEFARQSCRGYMDTKPNEPGAAYPYCNFADYKLYVEKGYQILRCGSERTYVMECTFTTNKVKDRSQLPFTGMSEKGAGGKVIDGKGIAGKEELMDYCPVWTPIYWGKGKAKEGDSLCSNRGSQPNGDVNYGMEIYGHQSMCFEQRSLFLKLQCIGPAFLGMFNTFFESLSGAGCYKYKCHKGRLMILAKSDQHNSDKSYKVCWSKGAHVNFYRFQRGSDNSNNLFKGTVICPSCAEICERAGSEFRCLPEVGGISASDPMIGPCGSPATRNKPYFHHIISLFIILQVYNMIL